MRTTAVNIDTKLYNDAVVYAKLHDTSIDKMVESYFVSILQMPTVVKNTENLSDAYKELTSRLEEMAALEDDWDDEGAPPIDKAIIATVKALIQRDKGRTLEKWILFPDTNGTLQLDAKERDAVISIGRNEYSYFYNGKNGDERASHVELTIDSLAQLINHINE